MTIDKTRASELPYEFIGPRYTCAYCGDPSDTEDHTVPSWFVAGNIRVIARYRLFKVAACRECNILAGAIVDRTILHRKRRIAIALRKKNKRILGAADWKQDEIARLGRAMRDYVESGLKHGAHLRLRLEQLDSPLWLEGIPIVLLGKEAKILTSSQASEHLVISNKDGDDDAAAEA